MENCCLVCKSKQFNIVFHSSPPQFKKDPKIKMVKCKNCGFIYSDDPNRKVEYKESYPSYISESNLLKKVRNIILIIRAKKIEKLIPKNAQVLEIGCGTGDFLCTLKKRGFNNLTGVEVSKFASKICKKKGLNIYTGDFMEVKLNNNYYDLVILQHVIEHFPKPEIVFSNLIRILRKKGFIVILTPNGDSIERRIFGRFWYGWSLPYHYVIFSRNTISKLLEKKRFIVRKISYSILPNDLAGTLVYFLKYKAPDLKGNVLKFIKLFSMVVLLPLSLLEGALKTSGRMTVIAEKG